MTERPHFSSLFLRQGRSFASKMSYGRKHQIFVGLSIPLSQDLLFLLISSFSNSHESYLKNKNSSGIFTKRSNF